MHAGKWQNFAAGIGTGAAYASLHGLHWHPHWVTIIEYVCLLIALLYLYLSYWAPDLFFFSRMSLYSQLTSSF